MAAHSEAVVLKNLSPNTQYQLSVTAVCRGHRFRSRQVIFRTLGEYWARWERGHQNMMLTSAFSVAAVCPVSRVPLCVELLALNGTIEGNCGLRSVAGTQPGLSG